MVGAAGLALTLSACFKMDVDLELNTDDTVDGSMVVAVSSEFRDMAETMGEDVDMLDEMFGEGFGGVEEEAPDYASIEPYDDGEFMGQEIVFDEAPLSEFEGGEAEGLSIVRDGEEFVVEGAMDMTDADPEAGQMEDLPPGMADQMDIDARVSITFPGEVLDHNGSLDGTTVTWEPQIGESNEIFARAEDSGAGGGFPVWLWIVIGVVVVAGIATLLFVLFRNKGEPAPAATGGDVPPPASTGAGTPAPAADAGASTTAAAASAPPAPSTDESVPPPPSEPAVSNGSEESDELDDSAESAQSAESAESDDAQDRTEPGSDAPESPESR
ncbi:hypothetical protein EF847_22610 [Actinobacteria bacterium YIM 96077]|uniref:LppM domain-containing protein n=1 Tax=Phytoactinopolyspora halophila TaxID=1981511 RepID=A0A329QP72_9ACTN|nr:hypothetical protein EF847_22610 [Actinobacteria bacterium YIM 96077]RAW14165.1 hypothetical protein DPM12_10910 [Phytoactinopolyspora halophila]